MPRGGHARSGPAHDPSSGRSESRGLTSVAVLPAAGYRGRVPGLNRFLPRPDRRHREIWEELWRSPQACVWINERWRWPAVAELVRLMVLIEGEEAAVGHWQAIRQRRDDLGLSTAGRRLEGWEIVAGVSLGRPEPSAEPEGDELGERRQRRLRGKGVEQPADA